MQEKCPAWFRTERSKSETEDKYDEQHRHHGARGVPQAVAGGELDVEAAAVQVYDISNLHRKGEHLSLLLFIHPFS